MNAKLIRKVNETTGEHVGWSFWCPGCKRLHIYYTSGPMVWTFNGDTEKPTFTPSLLLYTPEWTDDEDGTKHPRETQCHLFLTDGVIRFLGDCKHELAGKSVPLAAPPFAVEGGAGEER